MSTSNTASELPNRHDAAAAQQRWYAFWEEKGYFHAEPDPEKKPFSIVIPPPNVTGALHLGHALNNTLQDVLVRMKRMQGYEALWMPGTDHAGIATQAVVEKRIMADEGLNRHDLGREKLVERIWEWKASYEKRILSQLKQMGSSCDWERTRFTLDDTCATAVRRTFYDLFGKELIYRGKRLVNWDTFLQTAVSNDEVFHEVVKGHFWHFKYPVLDARPGEPTFVTIATTRPETMLGDAAVAVHPDPAAALDKVEAELRSKLAEESDKAPIEAQLEALDERRREMLPHLEQLRDMALAGRKLILPLLQREIPLVADEWAKPALGSGCVKITPAHDPNDYEVGLRQDLQMINILNRDGTLNSNAGPYRGLTIKESRKKVVADLDELDLLGEVEDREIDLAHSDRSRTPIEPLLADQWYVRMDTLSQMAMDAVSDGRVSIFPERYAKGYLDWLSEKRDWPISRQLWWGHQIPIWSQLCHEQEKHDELVAKLEKDPDVQAGKASYQVEINTEREAAQKRDDTVKGAENIDLPYATIHICIAAEDSTLGAKYEADGYVREEDVLDTWFSSALWPHSTLGWPRENGDLDYFYPTATLITSRDIISLWVARMVLMGLNNMGEIPFREVFIHPTILDGYGERMSKSKGNGVDPLDVIQKFGADALRFGLAYLTTETQDVRMPVQFECPHCEQAMDQTKKNRVLSRVECKSCGKPFSTQKAETEEDLALPRGAVVSERFELARNFCNKLWNASRFALINLEGFTAGPVDEADLEVEDRWILSRLATVTQNVTDLFEHYHYAEAARALYDFAWDEFCSFYIEMVKGRLQEDGSRQTAQRVLAHTLDSLLRLLHPVIPFITEEIWQRLGEVAPRRGLANQADATESIMIASWPEPDLEHQDSAIEKRFNTFQAALSALREIRSRQNIAPRDTIEFAIRCEQAEVDLLKPMEPYFASMANGKATGWGKEIEPPTTSAKVDLPGMEVFVDLKDFIDPEAERERLTKMKGKFEKMIEGKEKKLSNANFVERAPADVVEKERESLADLKQQLASVVEALAAL